MIKRVEKICKGCNLPKYLFGHGYCEGCYKKNRGKRILSKGIEKKVAQKAPKAKKIKSTGELDVFNQIWDERRHTSQVWPHKPLFPKGHKLWLNQFSHVCPKGLYEAGRLDKENIVLKTPDEHTLWEHHKDKIFNQETGEMILPHWERVVDLYNKLRIIYNEKYKQNGKI